MNAIELENKIRDKFDGIVETIAFFYANKNQNEIKERLSKLVFFVYDDNVLHADRISVVDRLEVAIDFAKDISLELDVDEDRRFEIEYALAALIIEAAKHKDSERIIKETLPKISEISDENYVGEILELVELYKNDYKIKEINEIISSREEKLEFLQESIYQIKKDILKSRFNINDDVDVNKLWDLIDSFTDDLELLKSGEFKNIVSRLQKEFYLLLDCKGDTIEELSKDAMDKGIIMSSYIRGTIIREYREEYYRMYDAYLNNTNNFNSIKRELDKKGYIYNKHDLRIGLTTPNINAINFMCLDKNKKQSNIIIYCNDALTYSTQFDTRCFHEIVHYLGGLNVVENKRGLMFKNMEAYRLLEESYVHFMSLNMAKKYNKTYGCILQPWFSNENLSMFNITLDYMNEVFKLYGNQLMEIHLSNDITLKDANKLIPYDDIAYSIARIYNSEDPKMVSKEEVEKLIRSVRK